MSDDGWPPTEAWWDEALAGGEIDQEQYDAHRAAKAEAARVYVQTDDGSAWCARHWAIWPNWMTECQGWGDEDEGKCVPMALYVEAPDP